jgi:lipopolysaccharide export system permease protein
MMSRTLSRYFALQFLKTVLGVFGSVVFLVFLIDFVETTRRMSDYPEATTGLIAQITLFRVPQLTELVLPFAVLVGAMSTFSALSRKLELVVARAAGVSAWQFVRPSIFVAIGVGVVAVTLYNPMSAALRERSMELESMFVKRGGEVHQTTGSGMWLRQRSDEAQAIINAQRARERGLELVGVTVFVFDLQGRFTERVEAAEARLERGYWTLTKGQRFVPDFIPQPFDSLIMPTNLTQEQVQERIVPPETISFWHLPDFIDMTQRAGLPASRYEMQYHVLLARPMLLVAMVLIAAAVSLRFVRMGGVGPALLGGVIAGFLLYVAGDLTEDMGRAGLLRPVVAAWLPPVLGALGGLWVLMYQEDG